MEVLGYVGGALVLGAVIMLGSLFWDDLGSTGRKLVAVASLIVPALGGAALIKGEFDRSSVGSCLHWPVTPLASPIWLSSKITSSLCRRRWWC